jgi:hypothetical protein
MGLSGVGKVSVLVLSSQPPKLDKSAEFFFSNCFTQTLSKRSCSNPAYNRPKQRITGVEMHHLFPTQFLYNLGAHATGPSYVRRKLDE